jgi:hypothetical protein
MSQAACLLLWLPWWQIPGGPRLAMLWNSAAGIV